MNIDALLLKIKKLNQEWIDVSVKAMPGYVSSREKKYSRSSLFLNSLLLNTTFLFLPLFIRRKTPKYVFQGLSNLSLIETLPASEVMVLGGRDELISCLKKGWRFHWVGYIAKSYQLYLWADMREPFAKSLLSIQKLFISEAGKTKYLFLYEDALPVGLTLSTALDSISGLNVVCIAHGIAPPYKKGGGVPAVGQNSTFNFIWTLPQKKKIKCGNDPATFVLGLPYEVKLPVARSRNVVLLGHSNLNASAEQYFYSLYHFTKIYSILERAGFDVSFRPHPQDDFNFIRSVFSSVCIEDKHKLLNSERKIYIGFTSSLLYEARLFGSLAIALDTSVFPYEIDFDVDATISSSDYPELPSHLSNLFDNQATVVDAKVESLSSRFHNCIKQIDEFNDEGDSDG